MKRIRIVKVKNTLTGKTEKLDVDSDEYDKKMNELYSAPDGAMNVYEEIVDYEELFDDGHAVESWEEDDIYFTDGMVKTEEY